MICYKYHIYALIQDHALKNASSNNLGRQNSFGKLNIEKKVPSLQVFSHTFSDGFWAILVNQKLTNIHHIWKFLENLHYFDIEVGVISSQNLRFQIHNFYIGAFFEVQLQFFFQILLTLQMTLFLQTDCFYFCFQQYYYRVSHGKLVFLNYLGEIEIWKLNFFKVILKSWDMRNFASATSFHEMYTVCHLQSNL